jgi:hypothetical protein
MPRNSNFSWLWAGSGRWLRLQQVQDLAVGAFAGCRDLTGEGDRDDRQLARAGLVQRPIGIWVEPSRACWSPQAERCHVSEHRGETVRSASALLSGVQPNNPRQSVIQAFRSAARASAVGYGLRIAAHLLWGLQKAQNRIIRAGVGSRHIPRERDLDDRQLAKGGLVKYLLDVRV